MKLSIKILIFSLYLGSCMNQEAMEGKLDLGEANSEQLLKLDVVHSAESIIPHSVADEILEEIQNNSEEILEVQDEEKIQQCILTNSQILIFQSIGGEVKFIKLESLEEGMLMEHLSIILDEEVLIEKLQEICSLDNIEEMEKLLEESVARKAEKLSAETRLIIAQEVNEDIIEKLNIALDRLEELNKKGIFRAPAVLMNKIRKITKIKSSSDRTKAIQNLKKNISSLENLVGNVESQLSLTGEGDSLEGKSEANEKLLALKKRLIERKLKKTALKGKLDEMTKKKNALEDEKNKFVKLRRAQIRMRIKKNQNKDEAAETEAKKKLVSFKKRKIANSKILKEIKQELEKNQLEEKKSEVEIKELSGENKEAPKSAEEVKLVRIQALSSSLTQANQVLDLIKSKNKERKFHSEIKKSKDLVIKACVKAENILLLQENIKEVNNIIKLKSKLSDKLLKSKLLTKFKKRRRFLSCNLTTNNQEVPQQEVLEQENTEAKKDREQLRLEAREKAEQKRIKARQRAQERRIEEREKRLDREREEQDDRMEVIKPPRFACLQAIPRCQSGFIAQDVRTDKTEGCPIFECVGDQYEDDDFEFGLEDEENGLKCKEKLQRMRAVMRCGSGTIPRIVNFKGCEIKCL